MITYSGYHISEILYESANSLVYRGQRETDGQPVVLKVLKEDYPSPERIAWFKREYEVTQNLNPAPLPGVAGQALTGVVAAYGLESDHHRWLMILEDFGGESLQRLKLAGKLAWPNFLNLAIGVTDILGQIHRRHLIHKDLNPSNIVLNPATGQVKIIDFGISTMLSRENPTFRNPNVLEGTLAYISPEQTGRMNRAMDYRTDFYSLGVTFYELLTGQLPFPSQDALELVHCHIAQQPTLLHDLKPDLPEMISKIVLKLIAKNAEERYQSAYGLKADLTECLRQWQANGHIEVFPLGQRDISDQLQIPQKLYGRERETEMLLAAFAEVSQGVSKIMLVSGYAGIGKSALVQEVYKPITYRRGYFISGKFDQLRRNIPYTALIQAFQSLLRQLLTESEAEIAVWREKLLAALGPNGRVIVEVIPEVELIIGPQPEIPDLPPAEAQNRFNLVFQNFITIFTQPEHPLVIFLDDLQWTDGASLKLMQSLMTVADSRHLFLIGAYRDNEVSAAHPLRLTLDELKKAGILAHQISLSTLDLSHVTQFVADACHCAPEIAQPLAELVLTKTGGNPFFMNEFFKSLYSEGLLAFDLQQGSWQWDLTQIQTRQMTDNVVELLAGKVQRLPEATQQVLELATCIGNSFDLQTLAIVYEKSPRATALDLWEALMEGLVLPLGDAYKLMDLEVEELTLEFTAEYRFAHDRIQQAAYSLISEVDKQAAHWRIGQLLWQNTPSEEREQKLFDIVNQLNLGRTLADQQKERDELAQLNLRAGQKAKDSAAYQPAFNYLQVGLDLLGQDNWQQQYNLSLSLYEEAAEAVYLNGDFKEMERLSEIVLEQAKTLQDKVKAYEVRIQAYMAQNKPFDAVKTAVQVLKLLEVSFPEQPAPGDIMAAIQEVQSTLGERRPEELIDLPKMTDPAKSAVMRILDGMFVSAFLVNPLLAPLAASKQVNLSLKYGNTAESILGYVNYGLTLCASLEDFDTGYQFGQLALRLLERLNVKKFKATSAISGFYIRHSKEHMRQMLPDLLEGYKAGLESGDFVYGINCLVTHGLVSYLSGKELTELEQEMAKSAQAITSLKQELTLNWHKIWWQNVLNWLGRSENPCYLIGEAYNEAAMLPYIKDNITTIFIVNFSKTILCYRFQAFEQALENLNKLERVMNQQAGSAFIPVANLYDSLVRLAVFPEFPKSEQEDILKKVAANQEKMKLWAKHAPMNYLHKFYLVEAERARILGHDQAAREYYDQAIELAHQYEYLNEESLAYELAARFYLDRGQTRLARYYLRDAHYAYRRWGATAKVKDLETRYSQFLAPTRSSRELPTLTTPTTNTGETASSILDLASVLKASQAISGEIVLDQLLEKLIKIVIENAGAQRGYLILEEEGRWVIEAEGAVTEAEAEVTALPSVPVERNERLPLAIINYVARTRENVVLNDASHEGIFSQDPYIRQNQSQSILCAPLLNQGKLNGILYLENNLTSGAFTPDRLEVLNILSAQAAISIENARLYARQVQLTYAAGRFVPYEFLQFLQKESIVKLNLGDQAQHNMTILVSDIRSFTTLSETMTPQENFDFVNAYLSRVSPIIRQHQGFIAKYMGDGLMAVFPNRVEDALNAAIAQLQEVTRYNTDRRQRGEAPIQIGLGIHAGPVMLGTVGEAERMQLDLLSDAVNVTARLEGLTKLYGVALVISAEVLKRLDKPDQYHLRFLGKTQVKGRQEMLSVFEVFDGELPEIIKLKLETKSDFEKGLTLYYDWQFAEAKTYFEQVLQYYPADKASRFYLKRMADFTPHNLPVEGISAEVLL